MALTERQVCYNFWDGIENNRQTEKKREFYLNKHTEINKLCTLICWDRSYRKIENKRERKALALITCLIATCLFVTCLFVTVYLSPVYLSPV